jgi:glycosyltransferase involved in cell wall biosynthesis
MNIAYLANFQGADLISRRRVLRNRALAGSQKIATLADLLTRCGCTVHVFSLGAVAERSLKLYPGFVGKIPGPNNVPVSYHLEWDVPLLGRMVGVIDLVRSVRRFNREKKVDAVLLYNCGLPEAVAARALSSAAQVPIVLEYEDDVFRGPDGRRTWRQFIQSLGMLLIKRALKGVVAVSPELENQIRLSNSYVLRGVLSDDIGSVQPLPNATKAVSFLFAGSIQASKGVEALCRAFVQLNIPGSSLNILGDGPLLRSLKAAFKDSPQIRFHGFVERSRLIEFFNDAHILVNPHCIAGQIGSVFPFKLIEYIGTGRPVVSTPMAPLDGPIASGILYSRSDSVDDLAEAMTRACAGYSDLLKNANISREAAWAMYGSRTVGQSLLTVLHRATASNVSAECSNLSE